MSSSELDTLELELDVRPIPCRPRKLDWPPNDENDEPTGVDSDERIEPSGSVKKGGSGKLSLMDGKGGVESVG